MRKYPMRGGFWGEGEGGEGCVKSKKKRKKRKEESEEVERGRQKLFQQCLSSGYKIQSRGRDHAPLPPPFSVPAVTGDRPRHKSPNSGPEQLRQPSADRQQGGSDGGRRPVCSNTILLTSVQYERYSGHCSQGGGVSTVHYH